VHRVLPLLVLLCLPGCAYELSEPEPAIDDDDVVQPDDDDSAAADDDDSAVQPDDDDVQPDDDDTEPPPADDAVILAAVLPTELDCGETFAASVEVQNTGTATWTRADGYKLGAVDDEDPLFGPDVRVWLPEDASVAPGESWLFQFELTGPAAEDSYVTDWRMVHEAVTWFGEQTSSTVAVACPVQTFVDPLTDATLQPGFSDKSVWGGTFSAAGWQTTGSEDQIVLEMAAPVWGDCTVEIDVTSFDPVTQYAATKHQIINMYTSDLGTQAVFETDEAWWNIRTGTNYETGLKFLAAPLGGDSREEKRLIQSASWDPTDLHTWTVTWDDAEVDILLDGAWLWTLPFDGRVHPLQYLFIGKDNVYVGQVGPVYSNLRVTYQPAGAAK